MARRAIKQVLDRRKKQWAYNAWLDLDELLPYDKEVPWLEGIDPLVDQLDPWVLIVLPFSIVIPKDDL